MRARSLSGVSVGPVPLLATAVLLAALSPGPALAGTATYTYDSLNRLTSATIDGSRIEYEYDSAGNITRVVTPYSIAVSASGTGTGTVTDDWAKIDCGDDCTGAYDLNTLVTLTAVPDPGMSFSGWSGACTGTDPCVVTVDGAESVDASFTVLPADLVVTKDDGETSVAPGETTTYTIVFTNNGPAPVTDATVTDDFPSSLTCEWTSSTTGGATGSAGAGSGDLSETLSLPSGSSMTYTAICDIAPAATGALSNTAMVSSALADPTPGDQSAGDTTTLAPTADLWLTQDVSPSDVGPAGTVSYTLEVGNRGPSTATLLTVQDVFPTGASFVSAAGTGWSCSEAAGTVSCDRADLGPAETSQIVVTVDAPTTPGQATNTASVSAATTEAAAGDESGNAIVDVFGPPTITGVSTVSATESGTLIPDAGTSASLTQLHLHASHALHDPGGATDPHDVTNPGCYRLFRALPDGTFTSFSCGDTSDIPILGATYEEAGPLTIALDVSSGQPLASGLYRLLVCASGAEYLQDAYGSALDGDGDGADGDDFGMDFEVEVTNLLTNPNFDELLGGWNLVSETSGDVVHDPAVDASNALTSGSVWLSNLTGSPSVMGLSQCVAVSDGATYMIRGKVLSNSLGPADPQVQALLEGFDTPGCAGTSLGTVDAGAIVGDTAGLWVQAWAGAVVVPTGGVSARVSFEATGAELGAESWLDDLQLFGLAADLVITKDDGAAATAPGATTTYTIVVTNNGPGSVAGAAVTDDFPSELTCDWASVASGGATGGAGSGSGNIFEMLTLPPGSSMTYTAICQIAPAATGVLSNTATVSSSLVDPSPGDESANDTTTLAPAADLWLGVDASPDMVGPGGTVAYTLEVGNMGPSTATSLTVQDVLPAAGSFVSATGSGWSCSETAGTVSCDRADLGPDQVSEIVITIDAPATPGHVVNTASISSATPEADPGDESDSASIEVVGAPTISNVESVAATEGGTLIDGTRTFASLTQLYIEASHELNDPGGSFDPNDVTNPGCYRIFYSAPGGPIPSGVCTDPSDVPISSVTYGEAGPRTVVVFLNYGQHLEAGRYRLLACAAGSTAIQDAYGSLLDGNGDGTGGDDFVLDFEVRVTNLLANPNLDGNLEGWGVASQSAGEVTHDALVDASDAPTSGSARLENPHGLGSVLELSQCVVVTEGETHVVGGRVQVESSGEGFPEIHALVQAYTSGDCSGEPLVTEETPSVLGDTDGVWLDELETIVLVPEGAGSARVIFRVEGDEYAARTWLDDLRFFFEDVIIFVDGFESGDSSDWSSTVGAQ